MFQAKQVHMEALARVQRLEKRQGVVERTGRFGTAFKSLLTLGSTMADVSSDQTLTRGFLVQRLTFHSWTRLEVLRWRSRFALRLGR
jgi:hypothetical protein